jgi:hypothetical protein
MEDHAGHLARVVIAISKASTTSSGRHVLAHGVADDTARAEIEDVGEMEPAHTGCVR